MTKEQAVEKITKLRSLAQGTNNPHEREVAEKRAQALMAEHHVTEDDLVVDIVEPEKPGAHPFDTFADRVRKYVLKNPMAKDLLGHPLLGDVLDQAKIDLPAASKDRLMAKVGGLVGVAGLFGLGQNKVVKDVARIYDSVTKHKK